MPALLTVWLLVVGIVRVRHVPVAGDLAEYLNNGVRLLAGELPYRDFWLIHPPGEVLVPAAVFGLGGTINAVLLVGVAISVAAALATYRTGRLATGSRSAGCVAAALLFFNGVSAHYGSYGYLHAYILCLMVGTEFLLRGLMHNDRRLLLWSGVAIGAGFCFRLYLSGAAVLAACITVGFAARQRKATFREFASLVAWYVAGTMLAPLLMTVVFWRIAPDLWQAVAFEAVSHATTQRPIYGHQLIEIGADCVRRFFHLLDHPGNRRHYLDVLNSFSQLAAMGIAHLFPLILGGIWLSLSPLRQRLFRGAVRRPQSVAELALLVSLLWGAATFVRSVTRGGTPNQLSQSTAPWCLALVVLTWKAVEEYRRQPARRTGFVAATALVATLGLGQRAIVDSAEIWRLREIASCSVVTAGGTLYYDDSARAAEAQGLVDAIECETAPGDFLFVTPDEAPPLYALTGRRNPTRYDSVIDLVYRPTPEKQRAVAQALCDTRTRLVIHRPDSDYGGNRQLGAVESGCPLIADSLRRHFEPVREVGRFTVYRRR